MLQTATTGRLLEAPTAPFAGSLLQTGDTPITQLSSSPRQAAPELDALIPHLDAEMSLAIALSVPLAAAGATLVACAATLANDACFALGSACLLGVFVVQVRARTRVKRSIRTAAQEQGHSERTARESAARYLHTWLG